MDLLKTLKFVRGAVPGKSHMAEMKHFVIRGGHIRATNGVLHLGSPIDFHVDCAPEAETLYKAISGCKDVVAMEMTKAGRLRIASGNFKIFVNCLQMMDAMHPTPSGQEVPFDGALFLDAFTKLEPFVSRDELRPWSTGILLRGQSAFATNNVCLVEYWIGADIPFVVNVPLMAVREVLRINEAPERLLLDTHSISFMYSDGRWIKAQLLDAEWPDLTRILNAESNPKPIPEGFYEGVATIKKFSETGRVKFNPGCMSTEASDKTFAQFDVEGLHPEGLYRTEMLELMDGVADTADFTRYPNPIMFFGNNIRGVISGMRE